MVTVTELPVLYSKWGYANRYDDAIVLHEGLCKPEYALLHDWILEHELKHTDRALSMEDFQHDMADYLIKPHEVSKQYFKFYFTHPGTWIQALPCLYHNGSLYWDLTRLYLLGVAAGIAGLIWWLV